MSIPFKNDPGAKTPDRAFARGLRGLFVGDHGAVAMILAITASLLIGALCGALDYIHYEMAQARIQMAIDVTALSAGTNAAHYDATKAADKSQWKTDLYAYLRANLPQGYMDLEMPNTNISADIKGSPLTGQTITISASGSFKRIAPVFLKNNASGDNSSDSGDLATVAASNSVTRIAKSTLELVMVLDNTGSMGSYANSSDHSQGTKIEGLRAAANNLVTALFNQTNNDSYVGLVPFTTVVNLKNVLQPGGAWMTPRFKYNATNMRMAADPNIAGSGWGGCAVEPRDSGDNLYAKAYAPKQTPGFTPFYYNVPSSGFSVNTFTTSKNSDGSTNSCTPAGTTTVLGVPLSYQKNGSASYCGGDGAAITDWWGQPSTKNPSMTTYDQNGPTSGGASTGPCTIQPALFLTQNKDDLTAAISNMQASGSTIIPTGLLWGWRMLRSDWSNSVAGAGNGFISTSSTLPLPETTQALQRVAIVLTDGENDPGGNSGMMPNPSFNSLSGVGNSQLQAPSVPKTGGGTLANGSMTSVSDINSYQLAVCSAMKDEGIVVYAITFGSVSSTAASAMRSCASPGNYYNAPSNATLNQIFLQIAGNIGLLRLVQ
jgi:Flp pilus assembly protein TadG